MIFLIKFYFRYENVISYQIECLKVLELYVKDLFLSFLLSPPPKKNN